MANNLENIIRKNANKATKAVTGAKPNVSKASGKQVQKSSANKPKQKKKEQKKEEKKPTWSEYASAQLNKSSGGRTHTSTTRPAQRQNVNTQGVDKNNPVVNALQYSAKRRAKDFVDLVGSAEKAQAQDNVVYSGSGRFKHKVTKQNLNAMSEKDRNEFKRNKIRQQTQAFKTEQTSKQIDKSMEKDLKQGAKNFTKDTVFKADYVPVVSDVMKYQAKKNAKTQKQQLKDSYTTEKGNIDKWVEDLRAKGVDVDHPENKAIIEQTYADLDKWYKDSRKGVNKEVKNSGKIDLSGRDIYKGGVKMVDEMADYAIPYGATSKTALKGAEKLMVKGAKTLGVKTSKEASKDFAEKQIRKAAMGKITEKAAQRNINLYNSARGAVSNTAKELTANAMQDATIGTGIDFAKAKQQGLKGEQLKDYMLTSAVMNAVVGVPMTAVAGRAGAKEFKNQLGQSAVEGGNKAVADAVKLSKQEAEDFIDLQGKINAGKASVEDKVKFEEISGKIEEQTSKLAVDKKGNVVKNTKEDVRAVLSPEESSELVSLRAKANAEKLEGNDVNRLVELQEQADNAFKINELVSKTVLDSAKRGEAVTLDELENAVKFVERNGSVAEVDKAQRTLEKAVKANKDRVQKRIDAINKISKDTGIEYRFVDDANMHKIAQRSDKEYSPDSMYHGMAVNENGKPVVYINGDSNKSFYVTIGHETLHAIKSADETEYKNFAKLITDYAEKNDPEFKEIIEKMKSNYKAEELDEEIIAELVGKHLFGETGEQLIKHIADTEPNVFKRLYNYIKKMFTGDDPELSKIVESFNKIYNETTSKNANNPLSAKLSKEVPVKDIPKQDKKVIIDKAFSEHTRYNNIDGYGLYYSTSANYSGMCTVKPDGSVEIVRAYDIRDAGKDRDKFNGILKKSRGTNNNARRVGNRPRHKLRNTAGNGHGQKGRQAPGLDGGLRRRFDTDSYNRRSSENRRRGKSYYSESEEYEKLIDSGKVKEARQMLDEKAKEYGFFRTKHDITGEEVYLSLDGKHMKSADLVTYDSRSNPIELGDRFDSTIEDIRFSKEKKTPKPENAKSEQKPKLKSVDKMSADELSKEIKRLKSANKKLKDKTDEESIVAMNANNKRLAKAQIKAKELELEDVKAKYESDPTPELSKKIARIERRIEKLTEDEKARARQQGKETRARNRRKKLLKEAKVSDTDVKTLTEEDLKTEAKKLGNSIKYGRKNGSPKKIIEVREERLRAVRNELDRREIESTPNYSYIEDFYANKKGNTIKEDAPKEHKPIMEKFKQAWGDTRRNWEDSLVGFETMAKKNKDNVMLNQTNDARNADKIAGGMITVGMTNADKRVVGKSLNEIFTKEIRTNKEMRNDFSNYLYHKVALDRYELGKDVFGHTSEQKLKGFIEEIEKKYEERGEKHKLDEFEKGVRDYIDNLNEYYIERGVVSRELMDNLKKDYPHYVPTNRVVELDDPLFSSGKVNYDAIDDGIKKAIGGDGAIEDLYKQMVGMTMSRVRSAEYNKLIEMYAKNSNIAVDELKKMSPKDLKESEVYMDVKKKAEGAEYKLSYYSNGKQITIPVDRQTFLGYRDALGKGRNKLIDVLQSEGLRKAGTAFKAPITDLNVVFGIRNGMRDLQQAVVNSKNTRWFARSVFEGDYGRMLTDSNNPLRKIYDANGGKWSSLMNYDDLAKLGVEKEPKGVIKWIEQFNSSIESVPRMSEFAGTLKRHADTQLKKKGYKNGLGDIKKEIEAKYGDFNSQKAQYEYYNKILDECDANVISEAIRNANDITLNFGRNGKYGKAFNSGFVPYMNPSLQGLSKLIRMFSEADAKQLTSFVGKFALFTQAPAIVNEWTLRDNEAYQNLPTREKDNNFFIWLGNDRFLKIPKPRENAVLAEPIDYIYRAVLDKGQYGTMDEVKQMGKTALDNVGVTNPVTDNLLMPLINTARNKDWKGMDIESQYDIDKFESKDRYDETTTDIAIKLGKTKLAQHYNLSPKKIDNLFDSYTGFVYDWSKPLLTKQGRAEASTSSDSTVGKIAKTASQPVTSQFIKDGVFSNKNSQKFWDKYTKLDKAQNAKDLTDKQRKKAEEKFKDFQNKYGAISTLNRAINDARSDKSINNEQVRAMRKELNKMYNKAVKGEPIDDNTVNIMAKSLGTRKALNNYLPDDDNVQYSWKEHYKDFKKDVGWKNLTKAEKNKYAKHFLDVYNESVKTKKGFTNSYTDTPNYSVTGVVIADMQKNGKLGKKEAKKLMLATGVKEDSIKAFNEYAKNGGTPKTFAVTQKRVEKEVFDKDYEYLKYGVKNGTICMALATSDNVTYKDRAYQISNLDGDHVAEQTNSARGFASKYGHSTDDLQNLAKKCDSDKNGSLKRDEIISTVSKQKKFSDEEKAMAYVLLGGNPKTNPFGSIGDYSIKEDTGMNLNGDGSSGGGGHRHRRGRRHGGGGHGGGSGSGSKDWNSWLKSYVGTDASASTKSSAKSVKNNTSSSALNEAYRKRVRKLM